jgi:hypothetical protein
MPAPYFSDRIHRASRYVQITRVLAGSGGQIREFRHEDITGHRTHYGVCSRCRWRPGGFEQGVQVRSAPLVRTRATSSEGRHVTRSGQRPPSWSCSRQIVPIGAGSGPLAGTDGALFPPCDLPTGRGERRRKRLSPLNEPALFSCVSPSRVEFIHFSLNGDSSDGGICHRLPLAQSHGNQGSQKPNCSFALHLSCSPLLSPLHWICLCWPKQRRRNRSPGEHNREQQSNQQTSYDPLIIALGFKLLLTGIWTQHSATPPLNAPAVRVCHLPKTYDSRIRTNRAPG